MFLNIGNRGKHISWCSEKFMVFSSALFLFLFLPITLAGYFLIKEDFRNYWLILVSFIFFSWSQPKYAWIILLNIIINYLGALLIDKVHKYRGIFMCCIIAVNLLILMYFKYYNFIISSINQFAKSGFKVRYIILPIGISFFTFQGMSYVIDVYRRDVPVQKNIFNVALYIIFFPQLIAGPIVRYRDIEKELTNRTISLLDFNAGIEKFIIGLAQKAIIANTLAVTADSIWSQGAGNSPWNIAWLGSIAYSLQIYFDFYGYSNMAIGLGRMFGFHFMENFNLPYTAESISDFWRKWHISLSSWFRDYVYIPLGGNRKHVYLNLAIVFLLTGIWHGAAWQFIAWGCVHGFFVLAERFIRLHTKRCDGTSNRIKKLFSKIYTLSIVNLAWVLFRADSIRDAFKYIVSMFGGCINPTPGFSIWWYLDCWTIFILVVAVILSTSIPQKAYIAIQGKLSSSTIMTGKHILLILMLLFSMQRIVSGSYNPFIYFQF